MTHPRISSKVLWSLTLGFTVLSAIHADPVATDGAILSVETAVREAREQNPELKRLEAKVDEASWQRLEHISGYLPHLSVEGSHLFSTRYARLNVVFNGAPIGFPSAVPQDTINLAASMTVFDGLRSLNNYRAANRETEAAELDLRFAGFKLEEEVRLRFYEALASAALEEVAQQNITSLEEHLALARATERSGMGTRFNVLRLEAQLEEARAEKALAEDNRAIARARLSQVLGRENADTRPLQGALPEPVMEKIVSSLALDTTGRQDLLAEKARATARDHQSAAENSFWSPKVSLFAQEQFYRFGGFDPVVLANPNLQNAYSFGVSMKWDLFDGGASIARGREAAARAREATEHYQGTLNAIPAEFETWKRRYVYNTALFRARQRNTEKSNESVRLAKAGLKAGTATHSDVLDAELDLFRARAGVVKAQADAAEALVHLEIVLGKPLANR